MKRLLIGWVTLGLCGSLAAAPYKFQISADRADCRYKVGEEATLTVAFVDQGKDDAKGGSVEVQLDDFGSTVFSKQTVDPSAGPFVIRGRRDRPGFLRVVARNPGVQPTLFSEGKGSAVYSVAYEPEKVSASLPCPNDFASYWRGEQERLAREVPLDPKVEKLESESTGDFTTSLISFATFGGKRIYGALIEPTAPGPHPILFTVPGAGPSWSLASIARVREKGMIRVILNIHPEPVPADAKAAAKCYSGGNYPIRGILESREQAFYHDIWLGMDRAVNFLICRPNVDRSRVLYTGGSQGGGSGLALLALNASFSRAFIGIPAIADVSGCTVGRISGWPRFLERTQSAEAARKNVPYFDAANFATMIDVPIRVSAGLSDTTCPPTSVFSVYNALKSTDKEIFVSPGVGHQTPKPVAEKVDAWLRSGGATFSLKDVNGCPRIAVDGRPVAGLCALPQPGLPAKDVTFSMSDFSQLGVRFFSDIWWAKGARNDWWLGEGLYDWEAFDRRAKGLLDASSDGWIFPRLKMDPPDWYAKAHPEVMRADEAKPDSPEWRALYRRMLTDVVRHVEGSAYADRVMGYHLGALHGSEWLVWPWPKEELPPVACDDRDPLPPLEANAARRAYIARRNGAVADALLDAAKLVKELTGGRKLVGAFFGYVGNGDHESFPRVVRSPYVDFFASPGTYGHRRAGQSGRFQAACTSTFRLHGKLYWDEADIRTYHAKTKAEYRCATAEESVGAIKRNLGYSLTGGWETWWFLLAGNDTFHDEEMLAPIRTACREEAETLLTAPARRADVAVFTSMDEYATSLLAERRGAPIRGLCKTAFHAEVLPYAGVDYDSYELSDVEEPNLPDYKVYVFPNAFTLSEKRRAAIERLVRRAGKTAVWFYAPGYYRDGKGAAANVSELTGVEVAERYPVAEGPLARTFSAVGENVVTRDGWTSVYYPLPPTVDELRRAFASAGAHLWTTTPEVVAAGRGYLMVHAATDGEKTICLQDERDVTEIYGRSAPRTGVRTFTERFTKGETRIYNLRVHGQD